jgi:hypothetical protein
MVRLDSQTPNGLELSCPAEAGKLISTRSYSTVQSQAHYQPSPPGQPKLLAPSRGFSQLSGGSKLTSGLRHTFADRKTLGAGLRDQTCVTK